MGLISLKIVEGADSLTTSQQKRFQKEHLYTASYFPFD